MIALIIGGLFLILLLVAARMAAACPLLRTLAISANCWAESEAVRKKTV